MHQGRPLWAEIDLEALDHNIRQIQRRVGQARVMAVVKANAYGHGAVGVARGALAAGATHLGVACVDEGVQLRRAGIDAPVVLLGYLAPWEAARAVRHELTPSVTTEETAQALAKACAQTGVELDVHLKIDTGMGRFGLSPEEAPGFVRFLQTLPGLNITGVYTHYATADEADKSFTLQQFRTFMEVVDQLPGPLLRHVANSASVADLPEMALDMVRPGIALYGCYPSQHVGRELDLQPVLALKSYVDRVHTLAVGETVSYGRTWTAPRESRVALIPCGYADGLPRLASNKGAVLVRGQRAPIVGRICMDQHVVDVTDIPGVSVHDEAVIIGRQGEERISVEEVAAHADTISYEVLCGISARVPREFRRRGQVVEKTTLLYPAGVE